MTNQSGKEAKAEYIAVMGEPLGSQYAELWQDIAHLHLTWLEFVELFGKKKSRIELLNNAAPQFFHLVQTKMWEAVLLHIARLTDPSHSMNNKSKSNLTLQNLPSLIGDAKLKTKVETLCKAASDGVEFARDWRNRHIAHRDLKLAMGENAKPLQSVQLKQVNDVLASFQAVLDAISLHYSNSQSSFGMVIRHTGAVHLLYLLDDGLTAQRERHDRFMAGNYSADHFKARDL